MIEKATQSLTVYKRIQFRLYVEKSCLEDTEINVKTYASIMQYLAVHNEWIEIVSLTIGYDYL